MSLTERLWGGVQLPALESLDLRRQPPPRDIEFRAVYSSDEMKSEEMFRVMLNRNQRKEWDKGWQPMGGVWEAIKIPVAGRRFQWTIMFSRCDGGPPRATLVDSHGNERCFHGIREDRRGSSYTDSEFPFETAIAFLTQIQADEDWVLQRAG